jgi:hypothetical protein
VIGAVIEKVNSHITPNLILLVQVQTGLKVYFVLRAAWQVITIFGIKSKSCKLEIYTGENLIATTGIV